MRSNWKIRGIAGLLFGGLLATFAWGETIELVTYFPATAQAGNLHLRSLTVGDAIGGVDLDDGEVLVQERLGINVDVGVLGPEVRLVVGGGDGVTSQVLFLPGAGSAASIRVGIGTENPQGDLHVSASVPGVASHIFVEANTNGGIPPQTPRIGLIDTVVTGGDVTTAPAWYIDNLIDRFRLFRQPNITTAGTEVLTAVPVGPFDVNGNPDSYNVGIGTTNPQTLLHLQDDTTGVGTRNELWITPRDGNDNVRFELINRGGISAGNVIPGDSSYIDFIVDTRDPLPDFNGRIWYRRDATGAGVGGPEGLAFFSDGPTPGFGTPLIEADLFIVSDGALGGANVGIGTVFPQSPSPANGSSSGNLDANDVYLRSTGKWVSQSGGAEPDFDSGWFFVAINNKYTFAHSLGTIPRNVIVLFSKVASGSPAWIAPVINWGWDNGYNVEMTSTQFKIVTAKSSVCVYRESTGGFAFRFPNTGYYRLLAWK